jgi:hypothetical protein
VDPTLAPSENASALALARALWEDGQDLRTFAVRGEATHVSGGNRSFFRFEMICERPASFLFTAFDPMGMPAFRAAVSGGSLRAADYGGRAYYAGDVRDGALDLLVPVPLDPEGLLTAVSGSFPFPPASAEAARPFPAAAGEAEFLALPAGGGKPLRASVRGAPPWGSAGGKTLLRLSAGHPLSPDFLASFGRWEPAPRDDRGGAERPFPRTVSVSWRRGGVESSLELVYREVSLGFAAPAGIFGLDRPEGFTYQAL